MPTLTDHTGALKNFYTYDPYGNSLYKIETASIANPWQYAGGYRDAESGLYLLGVRYYSPGLGRFLQQDPAGGGGSSQYAYAGSNPCNNSDPSGMQTCYHFVSKQDLQSVTNALNNAQLTNEQIATFLASLPIISWIDNPLSNWYTNQANEIGHAMNWITTNGGKGFYIHYQVNGYYDYATGALCAQGDTTWYGNAPQAQGDDNAQILAVVNPWAYEIDQNGGYIPG